VDCKTVIDSVYEDLEINFNSDLNDDLDESVFGVFGTISALLLDTFVFRLRRAVHIFFCPSCANEVRRIKIANNLMTNCFMPICPDISDSVMTVLRSEDIPETVEPHRYIPLRAWVVVGLFLLFSLVSTIFGGKFLKFDDSGTHSVVLAITIGVIITVYGALFVGSHLDALRKKFGLNS
jgi:hypothetical protein